jgi:hypothetical protein
MPVNKKPLLEVNFSESGFRRVLASESKDDAPKGFRLINKIMPSNKNIGKGINVFKKFNLNKTGEGKITRSYLPFDLGFREKNKWITIFKIGELRLQLRKKIVYSINIPEKATVNSVKFSIYSKKPKLKFYKIRRKKMRKFIFSLVLSIAFLLNANPVLAGCQTTKIVTNGFVFVKNVCQGDTFIKNKVFVNSTNGSSTVVIINKINRSIVRK